MRLHPKGGFAFLHAEETLLHKASSADTQPKNTAAEGPFCSCQAFCADWAFSLSLYISSQKHEARFNFNTFNLSYVKVA